MRWIRVRALAAVRCDHHPHRNRRAIDQRLQRAQIVGNAFRQHRHDAVRKINRIAALERFAIERRARAHVMGDVGDRDRDDMAAAIVRIGVRLGIDRVVVILGVGRVDGDQRDLAPVLAAARQVGGFRGLGFGDHLARKHMRNVVRMNRDQADGLLALQRSETFLDACRSEARSGLPSQHRRRPVRHPPRPAWRCGAIASSRPSAFLSTGISRPPPPGKAAEDPDHALLGAVENLDDAPGIGDRAFAFGELLDAQQRAVADAGGFARLELARRQQRGCAAPRHGPLHPTRSAPR